MAEWFHLIEPEKPWVFEERFPKGESMVGVEVKTKDGETFLVGNVNDEWGQCNCCDVTYDIEIVAWRRIYGSETG